MKSPESIFDHSPQLTAFVNKDLVFEYANHRFCAFWNATTADVVGLQPAKFLSGLRLETELNSIQCALAGNNFESVVAGDSTQPAKLVNFQYMPSRGDSGAINGCFIYGQELAALPDNQKRMQLIFDSLPAMVFMIDREERILFANEMARGIEKIDAADIVGMTVCELLTPERYEKVKSFIEGVKAGQPQVYMNSLTAKDGRKLDIRVHLIPDLDASGNVIGFLAMSFDVTSLNVTMRRLEEAERRFQLAIRGSKAGVWEIDNGNPDWMYTENLEHILGMEPGTLRNSRAEADKRVHPDDIGRLQELRRQHVEYGKEFKIEIRGRMASGEYRWLRSQGVSERDGEGKIIRFAGTIYDIDELKNAELAAEEQVRRRDHFLAMLSHEMRNPLTAIIHSVYIAKCCAELPERAFAPIEIIERQSEQMARLLDDLLDVSRVTRDQIVFEKKNYDFSETLVKVVEDFRPIAAEKNQTLYFSEPVRPVHVVGDNNRLCQMLTNLLDNASKYTLAGGNIWLDHDADGQKIHVSVRDDGIGIPVENHDEIFELFCQVDSKGRRAKSGLGVGLFLVKRIVQSHGGEISVSSKGMDCGSQFDFWLPTVEQSETNFAQSNCRDFEGTRLMFVEDHEDSRAVLVQALKESGFEVFDFTNGEKAISAFDEVAPDVAVIDIGLPGKSGLDVAREIRANAIGGKKTLLIAVTGYGQDKDRHAAITAGFDGHLVKPVNVQKICEFIDSNMNNHRT